MKSSNLTEQTLNNKKRDLEDAEQRKQRVLEAQLKIEEEKLRLETNVKKLNEVTSAKNKAALEKKKKKKEEPENQPKELKTEGNTRAKLFEDKEIENKYSLSNLEHKEQSPTNKRDSKRSSEDLNTFLSSNSKTPEIAGFKAFIREPESSGFKPYEKDQLSYEFNYDQDRILSSQINESLGKSNMKFQNYGNEEKEENDGTSCFQEKIGKQDSLSEKLGTRKSHADKLEEGELDMYRAELKDIRESLKNFDSNLMSRCGENNPNTKKLVSESLHDPKEFSNLSPISNNISADLSSNKGFHGKLLSRQRSDNGNEIESVRNDVQRQPEFKEKIKHMTHNPFQNNEESIKRKSIELSKYELAFLRETDHQTSSRKLQSDYKQDLSAYHPKEVIPRKPTESIKYEKKYENEIKQEKSIQKSRPEFIQQEFPTSLGRENFNEKTKLQLEISSKIKQLQSEKEKERKKNEEAALKAKQQILNQLKNKNQDYGRPSTIKEEDPEYLERMSENKSIQEETSNTSNRPQIREKLNELEILQRSYKQEWYNAKQNFDQRRPQGFIQEEKQRKWPQKQEERSQEEDEDQLEEEKHQEDRSQEGNINEDQYEEEDQNDKYEREEEEEEAYDPEPFQNAQREVKCESISAIQQDYNLRKVDQKGYKDEDQDKYHPDWNEEPVSKEQLSYAQLHSRNKQSVSKNSVDPKVENSISLQVENYEKNFQNTCSESGRNLYHDHQNRKGQLKEKGEFNVNIATFGRKNYDESESDEDREKRDDESKTSYQDHLDQVRMHDQDSEEDIEEDQEEEFAGNDDVEENYENYHRSTSSFGKNQSEPLSNTKLEVKRQKNLYEDYYNKQNDKRDNFEETPSHRKKESFREHKDSKEEHNRQQNLTIKNQSSKKFSWTNNKPSEETSEEEEDEKRLQSDKFNVKKNFRTANFGYNDTNKPTRVRKGWGEPPKDEITQEELPSEIQLKDQFGENEDDEEGMLQSYKQKKSPQKSKEIIQEEPKQEAVVLVFDDDKDKEKKQKQYENMMKRLERNKDRKERDRSVGISKKLHEKDANDFVISDNSGRSEETPNNVMMKSKKRIVSAMEKSINQKPTEVPNSKHSYSRKLSANLTKEKNEKHEYEEIKSVEPSAKSTKSVVKSPGGPNNNIFQAPKTGNGAGHKKNVLEFSKQSNRLIIKNAITNVCFAGEINRKEREEVLAKINEIKSDMNFIIVFKPISGRQDFKALYAYDGVGDEIRKIYSSGNAPAYVDASQVENYYRYNSGSKGFKPIQGNKNFSLAVDAVALQPHVFKKVPNDKLY